MKTGQHLVAGHTPLVRYGPFITSATPGTQTTHAHTLTTHTGAAVAPDVVVPAVTGTASDTNQPLFAPVQVVSSDNDSVTVKSPGTSVTFYLYLG
jgi:hypothetical protein